MRTYEKINEKIRRRQAVVVTAEEVLRCIDRHGVERTARQVDVVTTGTFGVMCSSGAFFNIGHPTPRMKLRRIRLNGVEAYAGLAAVDCYLGATQPRENGTDGPARYGGGHVIQDLLSGGKITLSAEGTGTDCYPGLILEKEISLADLPDAFLFCPRNAYQNYNCAVNGSTRTIHTYMGVLKPRYGNATYSGAGELSPLMNDPYFRTIGVGTRIFLGGGIGYVTGPGTQHAPAAPRNERGIPCKPAGTMAVTGDLKQMSAQWLRGVYLKNYGTSMMVGLGVPIPILDEEMLRFVSVRNRDIRVPIVDYSCDYPQKTGIVLDETTVEEIMNGSVRVCGEDVPAYLLSSLEKARRISNILKSWIAEGRFQLTRPLERLPHAPETGFR